MVERDSEAIELQSGALVSAAICCKLHCGNCLTSEEYFDQLEVRMLSSPALANRACCPRGIVRRTNVECNAHSAESHMSLPTNQPRNMLHLARLFIDIQKSAGDGASNQLQQIHGGASDATCSSSGRSSSGILAR